MDVPGFRKSQGSLKKNVSKKCTEGSILDDAANDIFPSAYDAAVKERYRARWQSWFEPVSITKTFQIHCLSHRKARSNHFDYKGIKVESRPNRFQPTTLTRSLNLTVSVRQEDRRWRRRLTENGDTVNFDFEGCRWRVPFEAENPKNTA